MSTIQEKALIVKTVQGGWGARITDKEATIRTANAEGASLTSVAVVKNLIAKRHLSGITKIKSQMIRVNDIYTLPWFDGGFRILPTALYDKWRTEIRRLQDEYETAVRDFLKDYPTIIQSEKNSLGNMYNPDNYPEVHVLKDRFYFKLFIQPIPDATTDFRVSLSKEITQEIKDNLESQIKENIQFGMRDAWKRLFEVVSKVADKLKEYNPAPGKRGEQKDGSSFRDSLIDNVSELCNILPMLNVAGDKNLDGVVKTIQEKIASRSPHELRGESKRAEDARNEVIKEAEDIMELMSSYV